MANNIIPEIGAAGSFEALPPFDKICDPKLFYTVEALRTVEELNSSKVNTHLLVGAPVGITSDDSAAMMIDIQNDKGVIVTIAAPGLPTLNIPSTYFKSFPLIDGMLYERLCYIVDLGPVPPTLKDQLNTFQKFLKDQTSAITGIEEPEVFLGTVPTKSYVSKEQATVFENKRQAAVTKSASDAARVKVLEAEQIADRKYIKVLEEQLRALNGG